MTVFLTALFAETRDTRYENTTAATTLYLCPAALVEHLAHYCNVEELDVVGFPLAAIQQRSERYWSVS